MNWDFDELLEDAPPEERDRLRRAHDLLVAAGAPPELPPELAEPPPATKVRKRAPILSTLPPRRLAARVLLTAGIAALAFGIGLLIGAGNDEPSPGGFETAFAVTMDGTEVAPDSAGVLRVGNEDAAGNRPMVLTVSGLDSLPDGAHYELWLTRERGSTQERLVSCGSFVATDRSLSVRLNAPYTLEDSAGWIVTLHERDSKRSPVIMTT